MTRDEAIADAIARTSAHTRADILSAYDIYKSWDLIVAAIDLTRARGFGTLGKALALLARQSPYVDDQSKL